MTVQFLVINSASSRQSLNGFSVPSDFINMALFSSWCLRSASKCPLPEASSNIRRFLPRWGPGNKAPEDAGNQQFPPQLVRAVILIFASSRRENAWDIRSLLEVHP